MRFRRMSQYIKDQNWAAVALDFVIVVLGVFIGVQLGNFNDKLNEGQALTAMLNNLEAETQINIDIIDAMELKIQDALMIVEAGRNALEICRDDKDSQDAVTRAVNILANDYNPTFTTSSMDALADRESFNNQFSPDMRTAFNQYLGRVNEEQDQLKTNFILLWQDHIIYDPLVAGDISVSIEETFSPPNQPSTIVPSVQQACQSPSFKRRFQLTAGFVYVFSLRLSRLKQDIENFRMTLKDELKAR